MNEEEHVQQFISTSYEVFQLKWSEIGSPSEKAHHK